MKPARICIYLTCLVLAATASHAQSDDVHLTVLPVQGNVYMIYGGPEGNIAAQVGMDGVMLVDAMRAGLADEIIAAIGTITPAPIRYIINTSADVHHTGGNADLAPRGMFGSTPSLAPGETPGASLVAHENVMLHLTAMSGQQRNPFPSAGIPREVYFLSFKDIYFNDEPVFIMHEPDAHSDGDSIVLFRKSDTIAVGDIFTPDRYPVIDIDNGGSVNGLIRALNHILDLAVPRHLQDDVVEFRNMVVIVRDRVRDLMDKGLSLREIQATRPTRDYDGEFSGSGEAFVAAIHASLAAS